MPSGFGKFSEFAIFAFYTLAAIGTTESQLLNVLFLLCQKLVGTILFDQQSFDSGILLL